ncbi:helix-turn-helix domain-containing protein [Oceanobacillus picturae]|uniref:helix-turn-helix domain-containing protein n=1 Tax=Oceanobacillus picturae TaxID=171693 RepID=UPI000E685D39|nr:helix-turn-helix domain-containing protein [Oceanobacillus picturae]RIU94851.1 AraC family transcriptional regulator [Oceanobacillus picturae]
MFRQFGRDKSLLLYKYVISYLIIFLIPYITISTIFYQVSVQNLRDEIVNSNIDKIEQVIDITDSRMKELKNIATRVSLDHRLTPYMLEQPYNSKQAIEELTSYKVSSSIVDELYLYYHGEEQIYSPRGTSSINTFIENTYQFKDEEEIKLRTLMEAVTKPVIYPVETISSKKDPQQIIAYLYPIPINSSVNYGTVTFFVKDLTFKKLIEKVLGDFKGNMYIFNEKKELLTSSNKGEKLDIDYLNQFDLDKTGVINKKINNEDYSLVTIHSEYSDWTYMTAMPTNQFYERMNTLKSSIVLILILIAAIGVIATIFMAIRQYQPIKNISQSIKVKKLEHTIKTKKKDELDRIRETIDTMYENSREMDKKIKVQQPLIRDQILSILLKGNVVNHEEMKELLADLELTFKGNHFFVVVVSFDNRITEHEMFKQKEKLLNKLMKVSSEYCQGFGVELVHDNGIALIVSTDGEGIQLEAQQRGFIDELSGLLADNLPSLPSVGVGNIYTGTDWINRSYIEANAALEYVLLHNRNIIYFGNVSKCNGDDKWYPSDAQAKFSQSLKQGDKIVAEETLKIIMQHVKEQGTSIYMLRAMCFDLINVVLKNMRELDLSYKTEDVKALVEFSSLSDLEYKINFMIASICEVVEVRKESHNSVLRDDILSFIEENYKEHTLSLEATAEYFHISTAYLSRFIKEQTGDTFTQYLWRLRKEEFKRQLIETDNTIKEIVLNIGYVDVANFTRKFKKVEGITPGQFRKQYGLKKAL